MTSRTVSSCSSAYFAKSENSLIIDHLQVDSSYFTFSSITLPVLGLARSFPSLFRCACLKSIIAESEEAVREVESIANCIKLSLLMDSISRDIVAFVVCHTKMIAVLYVLQIFLSFISSSVPNS